MPNETSTISRIQGPDELVDAPPSIGPLTGDEAAAAGWLSEALSSPTASAVNGQTPQARSIGGVANMGDAILRGLNQVSSSYMKTAGELHTAIESSGSGTPGLMGALQMHMSFIEVSLQADTVSKCISKSEQTVEQLVKQQ
jgi:hypothetical protein